MVVFQFSIGLVSPFVASYMLRYLNMSFTEISIVSMLSLVVGIFASKFWGVAMDRQGIRPVMIMTSFLTAIVPLMWIMSMTFGMWMIVGVWFVSGVGWVGFNLGVLNLPFALAPSEGRTYFLAVQNAISGLVFFVGAVIGGFIAEALEGARWTILGLEFIHYHVLFFASSLGRFASMIPFSRIRDVRSQRVMEVLGTMSTVLWTKLMNAGLAGRSAVSLRRPRRPK
jgi:MFS family permease